MWKDLTINVDNTEYTFNDLKKTQKEIDAMTDEELSKFNSIVSDWSSSVTNKIIRNIFWEKRTNLEFFYAKYKELRKNKKEKHPMWRSKGAIELLLMDYDLPITKFSTGFTIHLGSIEKNLFRIELYFNKNNSLDYTCYNRVYTKTKILTPEQKRIKDREILLSIWQKEKAKWDKNCSKWKLPKSTFGKLYEDTNNNVKYVMLGCYPRNAKMPIRCLALEDTPTYYSLTLSLFKRLKDLKTSMTFEEYLLLYENTKETL